MHMPVDLYGVGGEMPFHNCGRYAVMTVVVHHVVGGNERRHIASCLGREEVIDVPEILFHFAFCSCPAQSLVDIAWSAVVSGDSE